MGKITKMILLCAIASQVSVGLAALPVFSQKLSLPPPGANNQLPQAKISAEEFQSLVKTNSNSSNQKIQDELNTKLSLIPPVSKPNDQPLTIDTPDSKAAVDQVPISAANKDANPTFAPPPVTNAPAPAPAKPAPPSTVTQTTQSSPQVYTGFSNQQPNNTDQQKSSGWSIKY